MKKVIADGRISEKCERTLASLGYRAIKLPPFPVLPAPVASHPDMLLFLYGDRLICHKDYYVIAKTELEQTGKEITLTDEPICGVYPHDILFNAALIGDRIIGNMKYVSEKIGALPLNAINVKQGYAKCSCCTVSDDALICSDPSIEAAAARSGVDVKRVPPGHISLPGYDTGFIGGASGMTEDFVAFLGDLDRHPAASEIKTFCKKHNKEAVSLSDEELFDGGSLFFIE